MFPVKTIKLEKYIDELKTEFPVYGDFLRFFTIRIGDMPSDMATWLIKIGVFYEELQKIANNMLDAYVKLAFLQAGYVPLGLLEIAEEEVAEGKGDPKALAKEITMEFIDDLLKGEDKGITVDEYINLENPKECVRVMLFSFQPNVWNDEVILGWWNEEERDKLIEEFTEPVHGYNFENMSLLMVVDPLTYRLAKEFVRRLKQELEGKLEGNILLSTHELLSLLALDREKFEADWSNLREKAVEKLKEKYPFLAIHDEIWRIRRAERDIKEARAKIARESLREVDCEEIIRNVGLSIESLLGVLYHWFRHAVPPDMTFGQLLNSLRDDIINEFGEDMYNDLAFIAEKRNLASHPKPVKLSYEDVLKVVKKAELFQRLLLHKIGLKGD